MAWIFSEKKGRVEPVWAFEAAGVLWRILITDNGLIIGEDRDKDKKTVSFFCIDSLTGNVLWKDVRFAEPWWIGLEAIHKEIVFIHEYAAPDMPGHKKIYALDIKTGRQAWSNENVQFLFAHADRVYTAKEKFEGRELYEVDLGTGTTVQKVEASYLNVLKEDAPVPASPIELPSPVAGDAGFNQVFDSAIKRVIAKKRRLAFAETMTKNGCLIAAFYDSAIGATEPSFGQHLFVADASNGKILFQDQLNSGTNMAVPDAFLCIQNMCYYIKNRKLLCAIRISATM